MDEEESENEATCLLASVYESTIIMGELACVISSSNRSVLLDDKDS